MTEIDRLAEDVARRLVERKESIAVAESAAGGRISAALLGVAGASAYFKGGVVVYTTEGKQRLAGMAPEDLAANRSATIPTPRSSLGRFESDWARPGESRRPARPGRPATATAMPPATPRWRCPVRSSAPR